VQLKSGRGGSRPEGKQRGGARGADARARMAGEAVVPWWWCGQGMGGGHGGLAVAHGGNARGRGAGAR
jgi:hypothetical protein